MLYNAYHDYHSLPLASEQDKAATAFVTRYLKCPQGFIAMSNSYTERSQDVPRKKSCIDDTCLYDNTIEEAFFRVGDFLKLCGNNGIILKF